MSDKDQADDDNMDSLEASVHCIAALAGSDSIWEGTKQRTWWADVVVVGGSWCCWYGTVGMPWTGELLSLR